MFCRLAIAAILIAAAATAQAAPAEPRQTPPNFGVSGQQAKAPAADETPPFNVNDDDSEIAEAAPVAPPATAPVKSPPPAATHPAPAPRKAAAPAKPACKPAVAIVRGKRIAYCVPVRR